MWLWVDGVRLMRSPPHQPTHPHRQCLDETFDMDPNMPALLFPRKQADLIFSYHK
jgi:hypothetical protein